MATRLAADDRKSQIVDAALTLADALGPDRLTTQAVADAVGLTQPGVFRHFPTKHHLWLAVADRIDGLLRAAWAQASARADDPIARVAALVRAQLRVIAATPAIPAILFSRELHVGNDPLRKAILLLMSDFHAMLTREVAAGKDAGGFRVELAPSDAAWMLIALIQGLALRWSLGGRRFSLTAEGARMLEVQMALFRADPSKEVRP